MNITEFIDKNYKHFNAASLRDAAKAYKAHIDKGGKMLVTLGGAMSTAELGISLAEMIRQDKVHAICCTGANLEEDLFHLVAANHYFAVPDYRYLRKEDEQTLLNRKYNRVTDTCIPEGEAMRKVEKALVEVWQELDKEEGEKGKLFPHEFLYRIIRSHKLMPYQKDPRDSWLMAACEKNLPIFVPGFEDSTTGNFFAAHCIKGDINFTDTVKSGIEYMVSLAGWYEEVTNECDVGFFQIGGGISGDFAICTVPMLNQDLGYEVPLWSYFCQISDSITSFGSYSGATPNEKITWGKLGVETPMFVIESDATIVAPLIWGYVMGW